MSCLTPPELGPRGSRNTGSGFSSHTESDSPTDSSVRGSANSRRELRGPSPMQVPWGRPPGNSCSNPYRTSPGTTRKRCRAYRIYPRRLHASSPLGRRTSRQRPSRFRRTTHRHQAPTRHHQSYTVSCYPLGMHTPIPPPWVTDTCVLLSTRASGRTLVLPSSVHTSPDTPVPLSHSLCRCSFSSKASIPSPSRTAAESARIHPSKTVW